MIGRIQSRDCGMGSNFLHTIIALEKVIEHNMIPKIEWYMKLYSDSTDENVWDTYFELKNIHMSSEIQASCVIPLQFLPERIGNKFILHNVFANHVELKGFMKEKINMIFKGNEQFPIIGVHLRNTDRNIEQEFASPGLDIIIRRLSEVLKKYVNVCSTICIYIASDNIPDVIQLKDELQCPNISIIYLEDPNTVRSPNDISVHGELDGGIDVKNSLKAESILIDIFALAKCQVIIRSCSNVTAVSSIINPHATIIDISLECGKKTEEWVSEVL